MAMVDQLTGLGTARSKSHSIHYIVQAALQKNQQVFTGDAFLALGLFKVGAELPFQYAIDSTRFLFFA